jgi:DNA polymerase-3 subunit delta'
LAEGASVEHAPLLATLRAQPTALASLRRAVAAARVHHAYIFDGPDGVGKERAAFGLAQALVCERRPEGSADACGVCRACVRAVPKDAASAPLHPDVVVLARGLYDPAAIGRRTPETQDISIDQVRTLVLVRGAFPPHEGRAKVFIVRRAEELSISAANALLKTLEEPGARTFFVLLTSAPDVLLPTIRSRAQRVRFGSLPDADVAALLVERGVAPEQAHATARLAAGSMAAALVLGDPEATAVREQFVQRATRAIDAPDAALAYEVAEEAKKVAKETLVTQLRALGAALWSRGHAAALEGASGAERVATRYALSLAAIEQLDGNAAVQLTLESMLLRMRNV